MKNPAVNVVDPSTSKEKAPAIPGAPRTKGVKWQPNGYNKVYNEDDEIWQDGVFKDAKLWDGKVYVYDRDGILLKVKVYKSGVYHSDGQL
jgi:antitoxin component YwqK of YwqJK toxin-antitoxin module